MNEKKNELRNLVHPDNLLRQENVTNDNIWTIDETIFSYKYTVLFVSNLKTRCIIGSIIKIAHYKFTECIPNVCDANGYPSVNQYELLQLYKELLKYTSPPQFVHSDCKPAYISNTIQAFLKENHIKISSTQAKARQNQVSEAVNNRIKEDLIYY